MAHNRKEQKRNNAMGDAALAKALMCRMALREALFRSRDRCRKQSLAASVPPYPMSDDAIRQGCMVGHRKAVGKILRVDGCFIRHYVGSRPAGQGAWPASLDANSQRSSPGQSGRSSSRPLAGIARSQAEVVKQAFEHIADRDRSFAEMLTPKGALISNHRHARRC
jgi:hypothetical protein